MAAYLLLMNENFVVAFKESKFSFEISYQDVSTAADRDDGCNYMVDISRSALLFDLVIFQRGVYFVTYYSMVVQTTLPNCHPQMCNE